MKWMPAWRWENRWLLFALSGLLVLPWTINLATVPNVTRVYLGAWPFTLIKVFLFGLLWGVGSTLFGLAINRVGMVLGFALILGITSSFGSLIPMTILPPEQLLAKRGLALIAGTAVMVLGLVFLTLAGGIREHDAKTGGGVRSGFAVGLVHCIFSGIFSSMMNFSFVFGDELKLRALQAGARDTMAANAIWALTVTGGFVVNFLYCVYLLHNNRTWSVFCEERPLASWLLGVLMGLLWFGGTVLYGMGAAFLGALGGIVGWPIFMTIDIIVALLWGAASGAWRGGEVAPWSTTGRESGFCWWRSRSSPAAMPPNSHQWRRCPVFAPGALIRTELTPWVLLGSTPLPSRTT